MKQLFFSSAGENLHRRTHAFRRQKFAILLQGLSPAERTTLVTLLEKALDSVEKANNQGRKQ